MLDFTVEAIALHKMVVGLAGRIYGGFDEHGLCIPRISEYSTYIYINRLFCSLHFRKLTDTFIDIIDVFLRKTAFAVKVGRVSYPPPKKVKGFF